MTQAQDATNWQTLTQYKNLRTEKERREAIAQNWGSNNFGTIQALASCGGILPNLNLSAFPEKREMLEAQRELELLNEQIKNLREALKRAGMGDLL